MADVSFKLKERNNNGDIIEVDYLGAYTLCDNGYLFRSTNVPPMKHPVYQDECRWSEWTESLRKYVEYCFGILKKRWRILKTGVRQREIANADKVFKTCSCSLHNMILIENGDSILNYCVLHPIIAIYTIGILMRSLTSLLV